MPPYAPLQLSCDSLQPSKRMGDVASQTKFRLQGLRPITTLGRGNMGTVLLVVAATEDNPSTSLPFAMKVIEKDASRKHKLQRSELEKEILSKLSHPFLPSLYAQFESEKHTFLVMQFCSGGDLNVLRHEQPEKRFSETAARFYGSEIILALEYLHKLGIVYRDLKPENVLIQESGHIMLTDFDLSLKVEEAHQTIISCKQNADTDKEHGKRSFKPFFSLYPCTSALLTGRKFGPHTTWEEKGVRRVAVAAPAQQEVNSNNSDFNTFVGTEEYVAPEILCGSSHGFAVDWWTLGIFVYELIYGATPFKSGSRKGTFLRILREDPHLPGANTPVKDLIRKLLVRNPKQRLGSCGGAEEVKKHEFFQGVKWESVEDVLRPPFLPFPFSLSEFEEKMKGRKGNREIFK